jgi:hypothetical protein
MLATIQLIIFCLPICCLKMKDLYDPVHRLFLVMELCPAHKERIQVHDV